MSHRNHKSSCRVIVAGALLLVAMPITALAQSTAGSIFGDGPAGQAVTITSASGGQRHATINAKGRYVIAPVPAGTYAVALEKDGAVTDTRKNIPITVGRGAEIDFACPDDKCATAE